MAKTFYMPSEIARLVLGYLRDSKCTKAHEAFLDESRHLGDYRACQEEGQEIPAEIDGKTLVQVVNGCKSQQIVRPNVPAAPDPSKCKLEAANNGDNTKIDHLANKIDTLIKTISSSSTASATRSRAETEVAESSPASFVSESTPSKTPASIYVRQSPIPEFKTPVKQIVPRHVVDHHHNYTSPHRPNTHIAPPKLGLGYQRVTPRKNITPRKKTPRKTSGSPRKSNEHAGQLADTTLTPNKANNGLHIEPSQIVGEFINNPAVPDMLAIAVNKILNGNCDESYIENLATGSWSTQPSYPVLDINDEMIHLPDGALSNIIDELEQNPLFMDILDNAAERFDDLDDMSSVADSSPFAAPASNDISNSLSTPKGIYRNGRGYADESRYQHGPDVVKNLLGDLNTPMKQPESFMSSPFCESPFNETPITPGKIFAPDFNVLTASPIQQPLIVTSTFVPIRPKPVVVQSPVKSKPQVSVGAGKQIYDQAKVQDALQKIERKILPKGKCLKLKLDSQPRVLKGGTKRKITEEEVRKLLANPTKFEPTNKAGATSTAKPPAAKVPKSRSRDPKDSKKKPVEKVSRSLSFGDKIAGKQSMVNKLNISPEKRLLQAKAKATSAPSVPTGQSSSVSLKGLNDPRMKALFKGLDEKKIKEVANKARAKAVT